MKVLITGSDGFIGKNLKVHLAEPKDIEVLSFTRENKSFELAQILGEVDFVFHLAGVNRSEYPDEFVQGNRVLTQALCEELVALNKKIPVLFSSSTQAVLTNSYAQSKLEAEQNHADVAGQYNFPVYIYRLPIVFGKWSRPNYNSTVATFCHNIARNLPIEINDPNVELNLVYIDDVVKEFVSRMDNQTLLSVSSCVVEPVYKSTVGEIAAKL